jgi:hypothetical protein
VGIPSEHLKRLEEELSGHESWLQALRRQIEALEAEASAQEMILRLGRDSNLRQVLDELHDHPDFAKRIAEDPRSFLEPLAAAPELNLASGLAQPQETRPGPGDPPPPSPAWTERFKPTGEPAVYTLMDQVWLSPALVAKQTRAFIERRSKVSGDGSDHDPSWVTLDL